MKKLLSTLTLGLAMSATCLGAMDYGPSPSLQDGRMFAMGFATAGSMPEEVIHTITENEGNRFKFCVLNGNAEGQYGVVGQPHIPKTGIPAASLDVQITPTGPAGLLQNQVDYKLYVDGVRVGPTVSGDTLGEALDGWQCPFNIRHNISTEKYEVKITIDRRNPNVVHMMHPYKVKTSGKLNTPDTVGLIGMRGLYGQYLNVPSYWNFNGRFFNNFYPHQIEDGAVCAINVYTVEHDIGDASTGRADIFDKNTPSLDVLREQLQLGDDTNENGVHPGVPMENDPRASYQRYYNIGGPVHAILVHVGETDTVVAKFYQLGGDRDVHLHRIVSDHPDCKNESKGKYDRKVDELLPGMYRWETVNVDVTNYIEVHTPNGLEGNTRGEIGDYVWRDSDRDGKQDTNEKGMPFITVELYNDAGNKIAETETDQNGKYLFTRLSARVYTVRVKVQNWMRQTYDLDGLSTPHQATIRLRGGQSNLNVDFGYVGFPD